MMMKNRSSLDPGKDMYTYSLESSLTTKVKKWLGEQPDVFFYKASDRYQKGVSDIIACVGGTFVAMELKAKNGTATPHQKLFIAEVIKAGGIAGECFTLHEVKVLVAKARRRNGI